MLRAFELRKFAELDLRLRPIAASLLGPPEPGEDDDIVLAESYRALVLRDQSEILHLEFGATDFATIRAADIPRHGRPMTVRVCEWAEVSSVRPSFARLLYRLARHCGPRALELGTCLGVSAAFIAAGLRHVSPAARLVTIDASPLPAAIARQRLEIFAPGIVTVVQGRHEQLIADLTSPKHEPFDLVHIDGDHIEENTLLIHRSLVSGAIRLCTLYYDDIRWSAGMQRFWTEVLRSTRGVLATIDLEWVGLCVVDPTFVGAPLAFAIDPP